MVWQNRMQQKGYRDMKQKILKKYGKFLAAVLAVAAMLGAGILVMNGRGTDTSTKSYTEEEIVKEGAEKTYVFEENGITYLFYPDGTLKISGTGATQSFATVEEAKRWYLKELYRAHSGWYPEREEQLLSFRCLLDKVTRIEIEEGVTALGDSTFTPFYYVETVTAPKTVERVGHYVFLGTGQNAEGELLMYGFNSEELEYGNTSFAITPEGVTETATGSAIRLGKILPRPEEERGTVPDEDLLIATIQMGEDITYRLYKNGVLYITGIGATYDFSHYAEMERHVMEELKYVSRIETETLWFDMVNEILIEDSVERIGDNALALYKYVSSVHGKEVKELGSRTFFRMGRHAESLEWDIDFTDTVIKEDTFFYCKDAPVITKEE